MSAISINPLYRISRWGVVHVWPARIFITISHFVLACTALLLGAVLFPYKAAPLLLLQLLLLLIAGSIALRYSKKKSWGLRKKGEGAFLTCGFLLLVLSGPALREDKISFGATPAFATTVNPPLERAHQTKASRFLKKVAKWYVEASLWIKILNVVGILIVAAALGMCLAIVSCGIACNGYGIIAAVLFILGSAAIIGGIVHFCVRIFESKARAERRTARRLEQGKEEVRF